MSVFDTSNVSQQGGTNVSPVGGVVSDDSAAITGFGKVLTESVNAYGKYKSNAAEAKDETAIRDLATQFQTINDAVARRDMTDTISNATKDQLILKARASGVSSKALKAFLGIGGDTENFVDPQTKFENELIKDAGTAGKILPGMDRDAQVDAAKNFQEQRGYMTTIENLNKKLAYDKSKNQYEQTINKQESTKALQGWVSTKTVEFKNRSDEILRNLYNSGNSAEASAQAKISMEQLRAEVNTGLSQFAGADKEVMEQVGATALFQLDLTDKLVNGEITREAFENRSKNIQAYEKASLLSAPNMARLSTISKEIPTLVLTAQIGTEVMAYYGQNSTKGKTKPADVTISNTEAQEDPQAKQGLGQYLGAVLDMSDKAFTNTAGKQSQEELQAHRENISKQINGILNGISKGDGVDPTQYHDVVNFLADPRYIKAVEGVGSNSIDPEYQKVAFDSLFNYGMQMISTISTNLEAKQIDGKPVIQLARPVLRTSSAGVTVDLVPREGVTLTNMQKRELQATQRRFGRMVGNYVKAMTHVQGNRDYKGTFEKSFSGMFGEDLNDKAE